MTRKFWLIVSLVIYAVQLITAILDIIGAHFGIKWLQFTTKAIPVALLIPLVDVIWPQYFATKRRAPLTVKIYITIGLACNAVGDYFLVIRSNRPSFIIGTILFLVGHVFYVIAFLPTKFKYRIMHLVSSVTLLCVSSFCTYIIVYQDIKKFVLESFGYLFFFLIESAMTASFIAQPKSQDKCEKCQHAGAVGALLIFMSDCLLTIDRQLTLFGKDQIPMRTACIMLTYYFGHFLISYSSRQWECSAHEEEDGDKQGILRQGVDEHGEVQHRKDELSFYSYQSETVPPQSWIAPVPIQAQQISEGV
ncbi:MAG: hypothetical protein EZS28_045688 [Streblomastix strix]|uniref:Lysoplasmalogenase n=1 Tax=Streblomastix strix TaxID=222440 RepID=A0A5J4TMX8_9EUKA|nr:MAG: hypothetical protein EZS28_045688 [Streblomastix strix]